MKKESTQLSLLETGVNTQKKASPEAEKRVSLAAASSAVRRGLEESALPPEGLERTDAAVQARMRALCAALEHHNYLYHTLDAPEISDDEYDALYRELTALEAAFPQWVDPHSPTRRVGGALLGSHLSTIDPKMFNFLLTFNVLMFVVAGGLGSLTGSLLGAGIITVLLEWLRILEEPMTIGSLEIPGVPGMRMVVFSLALLGIILFRREGIMGTRELTWGKIAARFRRHPEGGRA